ncbi:molybdenum cofactor guanylyltransferase [Arthrobacter agilis]|uniref:molybdenum cofactor guanylyltransferase n=1 Tax=Arthrobacter agilis TaxID=37921 RepID=UPI002782FD75|nr:NTP transferase domain-containing protein [Arthrobacter agilis]MDQ0733596.1 molybdopterin-guanine dinucleotide biosynthesis protein A [Arthrobacter agilis]
MTPDPPSFDAIVLAGGRSSRLGGVPKAGLVLDGETLLQRTCTALSRAGHLTVVGPAPDGPDAVAGRPSFVREDPVFAGPAAAVVAGFRASPQPRAPWCAVVACDMPRVGELLGILLAEAAAGDATSLVAVDDGRDQPLAALYRSDDLAIAIDAVLGRGSADNLSMRSLLASVSTRPVPVPPGTTHDVDTWNDARELGVDVP